MDPGELTDGEIIECVRAGDVAQFSRLVERYQGPLLALAVNRLGQRDLAEDAVQEAFLCTFKWLDSYDSKFAFRTWLWTILLNQCRRTAERERRLERLQTGFANEAMSLADGDLLSPECRLEIQETDHALRSALRRLPVVHADAIRLRFFGELKFDAIAQAMGCSLRTAKYRVRDGLVKLGDLLRGGSAHAYETKDEAPSSKSTNEAPHALR
jgi:RNA polymerase sigma-70 factor, ECF subfamily